MNRWSVSLTLASALFASTAWAGWFSKGVGNYGPYTGGHGYSYATAYHYGFAWSAADTWKRDIFAYPGGINPYRPYGRPISKTVFPNPDVPYQSVPGPDGLPILIKTTPEAETKLPNGIVLPPGTTAPIGSTAPISPSIAPQLNPIPAKPATQQANAGIIKVHVPDAAEIWIDNQKMSQTGAERLYETPPLNPGKMEVYNVRAKWMRDGKPVEQFRVVGVRAGETAKLTFEETTP